MSDIPKITVKPNRDVLLDAIRSVETSAAQLGGLRFEGAFIPLGLTFAVQGQLVRGTGACVNAIVAERWSRYGVRTAASYGPWQMLYHTAADLGYDDEPEGLYSESTARVWADRLLSRIFAQGAETVEQVADAWNSGSFRDGIVPHEYIARVAAEYHRRGGEV